MNGWNHRVGVCRMSAEPLTCPFCNTQVPVRAGMVAGQKVTCPRCGEVFSLRHTPTSAIQPPPAVTDALPALAPQPGSPSPSAQADVRRLSFPGKPIVANRMVGAVVLGVMVIMATTG